MRIFVQRKASQQAGLTRPSVPGRAHGKQSRANSLLHLQRTIGNQAVRRLLQAEPAKLAINTPGDVFEQEADRVSEQVMRSTREPAGGDRFQTAHRRRNGSRQDVPAAVSGMLSSPGRPLDPAARRFMESRFGRDFSHVRVHTGARADEAARAVHARAFTLNHDIVFGAGQYDPHGTEGRRLLAHELTHVIQQQPAAGVEPSVFSAALPVSQRVSAGCIQRQQAAPDDGAFWEWWKLVAGFEGSLAAWKAQPANKSDRGGETNWGVTKKLYMQRASSLGLPPTEEGFAAMTPDQAMLFGRMLWKASGAHKIKNTGVAIVLADWYWGGIDLTRFSNLLKDRGRAATFDEGKPDQATIEFINTLPPDDLIEAISNAKGAQYRQIAKKDPTQEQFLKGWLGRNEQRRLQAERFAPGAKFPVVPGMSLWERGQRALREARGLLDMGDSAPAGDRRSVKFELWSVVNAIDEKQKSGFAHAEEEVSLRALKRELLDEIGRLMDAAAH